ncbi:MAG: potassium/proton antiporter [Solirubrobacteraceae bacterium]|nr:potassium/proton antiporter [Solirubrobacteraceae bacterium]
MGSLILVVGLLMSAALAASLLAGRLRIPGLLLFLGIGMAIGSDGLGWVAFDDYELARDVGIVALAVIIFEGGLSTRVADLRPVMWSALSLSILATVLTALITGGAAIWLFDLAPLEGLLLGSIVASTDAAAVFALLRGSPLRPRLARLLEGEAASNDPVAILLVLGFIEWISNPGYGVIDMGAMFARQVAIGLLAGLAIGWLATRLMSSVELATPGLYPVASLTVCAMAFGSADVLGGSGFLAVYLAGLVLGSADLPARRTITAFHDGLAWLAQLAMFLTLGLLVFPSQLADIAVEGLLLAVVLVVVARPLASVAATAFGSFSLAERVMLGWVGLRGAVPVVLATFPLIAGVPGSLEFFNIVFFAVMVSLLVQGPTIEPLARRLGLTTTDVARGPAIVEIATIRRLGAEVIEYVVVETDAIAGAAVRDLGLPREAIVSAIVRGQEAIPPRGSTRLRPGDRLHVLVRREAAREVDALAARWRGGPIGPPPRPRRPALGRAPLFTVRPGDGDAVSGPPAHPEAVLGEPVVGRLRVRRDVPGALVALHDGRYAVTGPIVFAGGREDVASYARRRIGRASADERAWLQAVIAGMAADFPELMAE